MIKGLAWVLAGAAALGAIGCGRSEKNAPVAAEPATVSGVTVEAVRRDPIPVGFEATGTVKASLNAMLSAKVMARVASVSVREGDPVRPGQVLVRLDGRELDAAVRLAGANLNAAAVGVSNAGTAATLEERSSRARIAQAEAAVQQARAAVEGARSQRDLAVAGPREQERSQARLAVQLADSNLRLAQTEYDRVKRLVDAGAIAARMLDSAQNSLDVARAQRDSAVESERIAAEGTRSESLRTAEEAVRQAQAGLRQAEAALAQAKAAAMQIQMRRGDVRAARAQVQQSAAALTSAQVFRSYATIVAPFAGVVAARTVDPGNMAAPGVPLLTIEGGEFRLEAVVPESVLPHARLGTAVPVRFDAVPGAEMTGKVVELVPQGDAATHTFVVKVNIPRTAGVRSGMFGRAKFPVGSETRLTIPASAVWQTEGLSYVFVRNPEGVARMRIVTLGETSSGRVEVLSGLAEGEQVVTDGRERIVDGARVEAK